jgi:DNA helicase II / ATP-dependent DNA helicase PcrA
VEGIANAKAQGKEPGSRLIAGENGHGLVTKSSKYEALQERLAVRIIEKETTSFEQGVLVIPSYLAKGMEFDAVVVHDASNYGRENERNLFYTVCTREMHALVVCYTEEMNRFLEEIPRELYTYEGKRG